MIEQESYSVNNKRSHPALMKHEVCLRLERSAE